MSTRALERRTRGPWPRVALPVLLALVAALAACTDGGPAPATTDPPAPGSPPPAATGKVTLQWARPTANEDGTALTDLAGYKVYYGTTASQLDSSVDVRGAAVTSVEIGELASGSWYFAIASYNSAGVESTRSGTVGTHL